MEAEAPALSDALAPELALSAPALLREFNRAGVLAAADVHTAVTLAELAGVEDQQVLLALAMAVRGPRLGHVYVDLADAQGAVMVEDHDRPLPWPDASNWVAQVAACDQLVAGDDASRRPLRLDGTRLYLDRYWSEERALAGLLTGLAQLPLRQLELSDLRAGIRRLFPVPDDSLQRAAAACIALRGLSVIAGGPGTGKTTAIARAVALVLEQAALDAPAPLVALCAPTGKAATRLQEAVNQQAAVLDLSPETQRQLQSLRGNTIHRLLGARGAGGGGFAYGPRNPLPHDLIIVDETSMVSLSLMTALLAAVRSGARVALVGDPDQLVAIEAGAVLRDIVGPPQTGTSFAAGMRAILNRVTGDEHMQAPRTPWFGDSVVTLARGHRFGQRIAALADAIRRGDGDATVAALGDAAGAKLADQADAGRPIVWVADAADGSALLQTRATGAYREVVQAARRHDAPGALAALGRFRLLCAHRHGPHGVARWTATVERWLAEALDGFEPGTGHYVGEPLLITKNDHELRLDNGDAGVVVGGVDGEPASAVFERDGRLLSLAPSRLTAVEPLYAMTIHKSQGSQFDVVAVLLPEADSPILTRELLYTAVTRAQNQLILVGSELSVRAAVGRPVARASGLQERLWAT